MDQASGVVTIREGHSFRPAQDLGQCLSYLGAALVRTRNFTQARPIIDEELEVARQAARDFPQRGKVNGTLLYALTSLAVSR
ncbi:MAG: hypothetical protein GY711_30535 [bacterium]|nr:hypothetical protein [bacterium]